MLTARQKIGNNIKRRLKELRKDPRWLARATAKADDTIRRYIDGYRVPSSIALYKIALAMDCTMESLMEGSLDDGK